MYGARSVPEMSRTGRHRAGLPPDAAGGSSTSEDIEARLLGQRRSMRPREVSAKASVSLVSARKLWHALGFPKAGDEDTVFTDADLTALRSVATLVREGAFDEPTALAMTRAFARTTDRLAVWQTQLVAESMGERASSPGTRAVPDPVTARAAARKLADLADDLEPLLIYAWRRHLAAAVLRMLSDSEPAQHDSGVVRCVGFADLVAFTHLVRHVSERELAQMVQRFDALASDVVTAHSGRVIKTVGDEVFFVAMGAGPAAAIGLDLVQAMAEDDLLPDVRVGMASGHVVSRLGDVFGTTVNRASRLTAAARPGTVLVDDALAASLTILSGFEMSPMRRRTLRGIGPVTPWTLRRADPNGRRAMMGVDAAGDDGGNVADNDREIRGVWPMSELSSPTRPLVRITRHGPGGHIAELALDRPEAMNAVSTQMARELGSACEELSADPGVSVVLVTSTSPKAFCVGADLKERHAFTDADLMAQRPLARAAYSGVLNLPMPTIAVVEGFALGGGLEIALSCDLIIAGSGAVVGLPEVSVGVIPGGGGTQLLTRRIGWSRAAGMIFTARRMSAAGAAALGVVDEVLAAGHALQRGLELAAQIAANSPVGLRQAKRAMRLGGDVDLATGLEVEDGCWRATAFSSDRAEGVAAFAEKRPARWSGHEAEDGSTMRS
jgi:adenylate cyclase